MHIIKMTTRGRITLPADIRRKFGIKRGTPVRFRVDEDKKRILITPMTGKYFRSLAGALKTKRGRNQCCKR